MAVPPRRTRIPGTFFVTSRTWESRKIFTKSTACEIFMEVLLHYRSEGAYFLHAFVLMPDHFHMLLTPGPTTTLERAVQFIKGGSARRISQRLNFRFPVWQRGFSDHRIRDAQDYAAYLRYIEENPVKRCIVLAAKEYSWSSVSGRVLVDEPPQGLKPPARGALLGTVKTVP